MFVVIVGAVWSSRKDFDWTADWLPLMSTANHLTVFAPGLLFESTSPTERARWALYVGDDSVGVEPSVVYRITEGSLSIENRKLIGDLSWDTPSESSVVVGAVTSLP